MNKRLLLLLLICLGIPSAFFVQRITTTQQRFRNARLMNETTHSMMELSLAAMQYAQDYNDKLPPMQNPAALKQALRPYAGSSTFTSPASGQPFMPNSALVGRTLNSVSNNETVLFYDPRPILGPNNFTDRYRVVGYWNHAIAMPEARWQRTKKESRIK